MKIKLAISIALITASNLALADNSQKRYFVESAKIDYTIKGSGNVFGVVKSKTIGKKRLIFNQYGVNELEEKNKIEKRTTGSKTNTIKSHTLKYKKGSVVYSVDFKKQRIMRIKDSGLAMAQMMTGGKSMAQTGEAMMKKMGGKKIGTDKVAGYSCDIWDLMGVKQCIYKGVPLKVESDLMGVKSIEVATKAEFGLSLSNDDFKLPDYPVYGMGDDMSQPPKKLDKQDLDKLDARAEKQQSKEAKGMEDFAKAMAAAAMQAGMEKGKAPSKDQQETMAKAMQNMMLPMIKQKALGQEKMMRFGKSCLEKADTLKEANQCGKEVIEKYPDTDKDDISFDQWDASTKKKVLGEIESFLAATPCIKKANTMAQLNQCMPEK